MSSPARRSGSLSTQLPQIAEEDNTEPLRRGIDKILGIDTTRQPRNAFAEDGLRMHRHRLAGNAFYQEQYTQRKNTPPTVTHPALRYNTDIYDISQPLPELSADMAHHRPSFEMQEVSPRRAHNSSSTTMSPFINAGFKNERVASPPLRLAPTPNVAQVPTFRNHLDEGAAADVSGSSDNDQFISTTKYSPKVITRDFGHNSQQFETLDTTRPPTSPKKSLLGRFRVSNRREAVPIQPLPAMDMASMPAKARAVLVAAPPNRSIPRSPSKTKGFWSRRKPYVSGDIEHGNPVLKAPPRSAHPVFGKDELPGFTHLHSLGYADNSLPPTPLPKDTPPEEKARRDLPPSARFAAEMLEREAHEASTPTRQTGFLSMSNRLSPNKLGGYSRHCQPTLVTQRSTRSLRASVVPNALDEQSFDDMKGRVNGLCLGGFSLPDENRQNAAYSPSLYSPDFGRQSVGTFTPNHKKSKSASDTHIPGMGSISIIYPELARDPSMVSLSTPPDNSMVGANMVSTSDFTYADSLRQERMPTVRRGGIDVVIHEVNDMLEGKSSSPSDSSLFAIPLGTSSAQVSPLHLQPATFRQDEGLRILPDLQPAKFNSEGHQILPATTYNPWDVQKQSNHPPSRSPRSSRNKSPRLAEKKSTPVMPGLEYDSGIDVDPRKAPAQDSTTCRPPRTSSTSWSSPPKKEKHTIEKERNNMADAADLNNVNMGKPSDYDIKAMIANCQQNDIENRLSDIEESMKQDAKAVSIASLQRPMSPSNENPQRGMNDVQERRRIEQEALFVSAAPPSQCLPLIPHQDLRIASLEIDRASREPSPTNCYGNPDTYVGRHGSQKISSSPSHSVKDRKSPKQRHSVHAQSPDDRSGTKRISTGEAREFYQSQLKDSPVMNAGNVGTFGSARKTRTSPETSKPSRFQTDDATPQVPTLLQESAKIRQLQWKVDRQNEWIQATMARMEAIETKYQTRNSEEN